MIVLASEPPDRRSVTGRAAVRRGLTRRQRWRVAKVHEERVQRARRHLERLGTEAPAGALGPEQAGLVITHHGATSVVEAPDGSRLRCAARSNLVAPVAGDHVVFQAARDTGVIVAVLKRANALTRPDPHGRARPVAANIDQVLVVAAVLPELTEGLIDRYLVASEHVGIAPVLVLNKLDLLEPRQREEMDRRLRPYCQAGYPVLYASTHTSHGLDALRQRLASRTSVLVGQSGVGKSSLINSLLPAEQIRIGALSAADGRGQHTTSTATVYRLPEGGRLIDSPGVRAFGLDHLEPEDVDRGFVEFRPYLGRCRYRNCRHVLEPGCAIAQAVTRGEIAPRRWESYRRIRTSLTT